MTWLREPGDPRRLRVIIPGDDTGEMRVEDADTRQRIEGVERVEIIADAHELRRVVITLIDCAISIGEAA